jgi:putative DNA primase/helicase
MCDMISKHEYFYVIRQDKDEEFWIYRNGLYIPEGKTYIREYVRKILYDQYTPQLANAVVARFVEDSYIDQDDFFEEEDPRYIPFNNGIYDIKTKTLNEFTPKLKFFSKIPHDYVVGAVCPQIINHLNNVLSEEKDVKFFQELIGYCMYRSYKIRCSVMCEGTGSNGKSITFDMIKNFLGCNNCSNITVHRLENDGWAAGQLHKKLANLAPDLPRKPIGEESILKYLVGDDDFNAPRKHKTDVNFKNYAKMIFACNELPMALDNTEGFWSRWKLISFPYRFYQSKEEFKEAIKENPKAKLGDENIKEKLFLQSEMEGLVIWALKGLHRLLKNNGFTLSDNAKSTQDLWEAKGNSVAAFCKEYVTDGDIDDYISKSLFKQKYKNYCKEKSIRMRGERAINSWLLNHVGAFDEVKGIKKKDGSFYSERVWEGIRWTFSEF